jgi:hypothetical protein
LGILLPKETTTMKECKHGLRSGCSYCHAPASAASRSGTAKRRARSSPLGEKMNDRMAALKKRLREIRGE